MNSLLRIFLTGLLAALPLAATVAVFWWTASTLVQWLGPQSAVGQVLSALGLGVTGSSVAAYTIGVLLVAVVIFLLGLLVQTRVRHDLQRALRGLLDRLPLVRNVYDIIQRVVDLVAQRDTDSVKSMSAVWCHFGGAPAAGEAGRAMVLGLLSTPKPVWIGGRAYLGVIVPTAPVPVGGGLLYLPVDWVTPAGVGFEAVTSLYVSMGLTSAQYFVEPAPAKE